MLLAVAAAFPYTISLLGTYSMAEEADDRQVHTAGLRILPGFLVDLHVASLVVRPGEGLPERRPSLRNVYDRSNWRTLWALGERLQGLCSGRSKRRQVLPHY